MEQAKGFYYIESKGRIFELSSVTSSSRTTSGSTTKYPVGGGSALYRNHMNSNATASISGVLSNALDKDGSILKDWVEELQALKKSGEPFTVHWSGNMPPLENCVFSSLDMEHTGTNGQVVRGGKIISSYKVSMAFVQIRSGTKGDIQIVVNEGLHPQLAGLRQFNRSLKKTTFGLEIDIPDYPASELNVDLQENTYKFFFFWNDTTKAWSMSVADVSGKRGLIIADYTLNMSGNNIKRETVITNRPLMRDKFKGDLVLVSRAATLDPMGLDNLGVGRPYGLVYRPSEE